ncbi:MAG: RNase adapter RapZ [Deltaproteobacteria bacterium]|nr:RNase adapter RapZ [Deltaproteobacteria bacterium]
MRDLRVVLITGLSGSGKTTAIKALEDMGFYCVDNLPIVLFPKFLELCRQSVRGISKVGLVIDIRGEEFMAGAGEVIGELKRKKLGVEVVFLEASDEILVRRYRETRRHHPLAVGVSVREGIRMERERLMVLRNMSDKVIDTSGLNVHQLKETITRFFLMGHPLGKMAITLMSFGYSFGIPYDADIILDVRFLANPFFVDHLKDLTGEEGEVRRYVLGWPETREFITRVRDLIEYLVPLFEKEGKAYLTIAIGCTGGRHRSVVVVNELGAILGKALAREGPLLVIRHRDLEKG